MRRFKDRVISMLLAFAMVIPMTSAFGQYVTDGSEIEEPPIEPMAIIPVGDGDFTAGINASGKLSGSIKIADGTAGQPVVVGIIADHAYLYPELDNPTWSTNTNALLASQSALGGAFGTEFWGDYSTTAPYQIYSGTLASSGAQTFDFGTLAFGKGNTNLSYDAIKAWYDDSSNNYSLGTHTTLAYRVIVNVNNGNYYHFTLNIGPQYIITDGGKAGGNDEWLEQSDYGFSLTDTTGNPKSTIAVEAGKRIHLSATPADDLQAFAGWRVTGGAFYKEATGSETSASSAADVWYEPDQSTSVMATFRNLTVPSLELLYSFGTEEQETVRDNGVSLQYDATEGSLNDQDLKLFLKNNGEQSLTVYQVTFGDWATHLVEASRNALLNPGPVSGESISSGVLIQFTDDFEQGGAYEITSNIITIEYYGTAAGDSSEHFITTFVLSTIKNEGGLYAEPIIIQTTKNFNPLDVEGISHIVNVDTDDYIFVNSDLNSFGMGSYSDWTIGSQDGDETLDLAVSSVSAELVEVTENEIDDLAYAYSTGFNGNEDPSVAHDLSMQEFKDGITETIYKVSAGETASITVSLNGEIGDKADTYSDKVYASFVDAASLVNVPVEIAIPVTVIVSESTIPNTTVTVSLLNGGEGWIGQTVTLTADGKTFGLDDNLDGTYSSASIPLSDEEGTNKDYEVKINNIAVGNITATKTPGAPAKYEFFTVTANVVGIPNKPTIECDPDFYKGTADNIAVAAKDDTISVTFKDATELSGFEFEGIARVPVGAGKVEDETPYTWTSTSNSNVVVTATYTALTNRVTVADLTYKSQVGYGTATPADVEYGKDTALTTTAVNSGYNRYAATGWRKDSGSGTLDSTTSANTTLKVVEGIATVTPLFGGVSAVTTSGGTTNITAGVTKSKGQFDTNGGTLGTVYLHNLGNAASGVLTYAVVNTGDGQPNSNFTLDKTSSTTALAADGTDTIVVSYVSGLAAATSAQLKITDAGNTEANAMYIPLSLTIDAAGNFTGKVTVNLDGTKVTASNGNITVVVNNTVATWNDTDKTYDVTGLAPNSDSPYAVTVNGLSTGATVKYTAQTAMIDVYSTTLAQVAGGAATFSAYGTGTGAVAAGKTVAYTPAGATLTINSNPSAGYSFNTTTGWTATGGSFANDEADGTTYTTAAAAATITPAYSQKIGEWDPSVTTANVKYKSVGSTSVIAVIDTTDIPDDAGTVTYTIANNDLFEINGTEIRIKSNVTAANWEAHRPSGSSYTVTANVTAAFSTGYTDVSVPFTFTVIKGDLTPNVSTGTVSYSGSTKENVAIDFTAPVKRDATTVIYTNGMNQASGATGTSWVGAWTATVGGSSVTTIQPGEKTYIFQYAATDVAGGDQAADYNTPASHSVTFTAGETNYSATVVGTANPNPEKPVYNTANDSINKLLNTIKVTNTSTDPDATIYDVKAEITGVKAKPTTVSDDDVKALFALGTDIASIAPDGAHGEITVSLSTALDAATTTYPAGTYTVTVTVTGQKTDGGTTNFLTSNTVDVSLTIAYAEANATLTNFNQPVGGNASSTVSPTVTPVNATTTTALAWTTGSVVSGNFAYNVKPGNTVTITADAGYAIPFEVAIDGVTVDTTSTTSGSTKTVTMNGISYSVTPSTKRGSEGWESIAVAVTYNPTAPKITAITMGQDTLDTSDGTIDSKISGMTLSGYSGVYATDTAISYVYAVTTSGTTSATAAEIDGMTSVTGDVVLAKTTATANGDLTTAQTLAGLVANTQYYIHAYAAYTDAAGQLRVGPVISQAFTTKRILTATAYLQGESATPTKGITGGALNIDLAESYVVESYKIVPDSKALSVWWNNNNGYRAEYYQLNGGAATAVENTDKVKAVKQEITASDNGDQIFALVWGSVIEGTLAKSGTAANTILKNDGFGQVELTLTGGYLAAEANENILSVDGLKFEIGYYTGTNWTTVATYEKSDAGVTVSGANVIVKIPDTFPTGASISVRVEHTDTYVAAALTGAGVSWIEAKDIGTVKKLITVATPTVQTVQYVEGSAETLKDKRGGVSVTFAAPADTNEAGAVATYTVILYQDNTEVARKTGLTSVETVYFESRGSTYVDGNGKTKIIPEENYSATVTAIADPTKNYLDSAESAKATAAPAGKVLPVYPDDFLAITGTWSKTYDGAAFSMTGIGWTEAMKTLTGNTNLGTLDNEQIVIKYFDNAIVGDTGTTVAPTNVGTYTVKLSVVGKSFFLDLDEVTIGTLSITDQSITEINLNGISVVGGEPIVTATNAYTVKTEDQGAYDLTTSTAATWEYSANGTTYTSTGADDDFRYGAKYRVMVQLTAKDNYAFPTDMAASAVKWKLDAAADYDSSTNTAITVASNGKTATVTYTFDYTEALVSTVTASSTVYDTAKLTGVTLTSEKEPARLEYAVTVRATDDTGSAVAPAANAWKTVQGTIWGSATAGVYNVTFSQDNGEIGTADPNRIYDIYVRAIVDGNVKSNENVHGNATTPYMIKVTHNAGSFGEDYAKVYVGADAIANGDDKSWSAGTAVNINYGTDATRYDTDAVTVTGDGASKGTFTTPVQSIDIVPVNAVGTGGGTLTVNLDIVPKYTLAYNAGGEGADFNSAAPAGDTYNRDASVDLPTWNGAWTGITNKTFDGWSAKGIGGTKAFASGATPAMSAIVNASQSANSTTVKPGDTVTLYPYFFSSTFGFNEGVNNSTIFTAEYNMAASNMTTSSVDLETLMSINNMLNKNNLRLEITNDTATIATATGNVAIGDWFEIDGTDHKTLRVKPNINMDFVGTIDLQIKATLDSNTAVTTLKVVFTKQTPILTGGAPELASGTYFEGDNIASKVLGIVTDKYVTGTKLYDKKNDTIALGAWTSNVTSFPAITDDDSDTGNFNLTFTPDAATSLYYNSVTANAVAMEWDVRNPSMQFFDVVNAAPANDMETKLYVVHPGTDAQTAANILDETGTTVTGADAFSVTFINTATSPIDKTIGSYQLTYTNAAGTAQTFTSFFSAVTGSTSGNITGIADTDFASWFGKDADATKTGLNVATTYGYNFALNLTSFSGVNWADVKPGDVFTLKIDLEFFSLTDSKESTYTISLEVLPATIGSVTLTNLGVPVSGGTIGTFAGLDAAGTAVNAGYVQGNAGAAVNGNNAPANPATQYTGTVTYNGVDTGTFGNNAYTALITLNATEGYILPELGDLSSYSVTLAGAGSPLTLSTTANDLYDGKAVITRSEDGKTVTISYRFGATAPGLDVFAIPTGYNTMKVTSVLPTGGTMEANAPTRFVLSTQSNATPSAEALWNYAVTPTTANAGLAGLTEANIIMDNGGEMSIGTDGAPVSAGGNFALTIANGKLPSDQKVYVYLVSKLTIGGDTVYATAAPVAVTLYARNYIKTDVALPDGAITSLVYNQKGTTETISSGNTGTGMAAGAVTFDSNFNAATNAISVKTDATDTTGAGLGSAAVTFGSDYANRYGIYRWTYGATDLGTAGKAYETLADATAATATVANGTTLTAYTYKKISGTPEITVANGEFTVDPDSDFLIGNTAVTDTQLGDGTVTYQWYYWNTTGTANTDPRTDTSNWTAVGAATSRSYTANSSDGTEGKTLAVVVTYIDETITYRTETTSTVYATATARKANGVTLNASTMVGGVDADNAAVTYRTPVTGSGDHRGYLTVDGDLATQIRLDGLGFSVTYDTTDVVTGKIKTDTTVTIPDGVEWAIFAEDGTSATTIATLTGDVLTFTKAGTITLQLQSTSDSTKKDSVKIKMNPYTVNFGVTTGTGTKVYDATTGLPSGSAIDLTAVQSDLTADSVTVGYQAGKGINDLFELADDDAGTVSVVVKNPAPTVGDILILADGTVGAPDMTGFYTLGSGTASGSVVITPLNLILTDILAAGYDNTDATKNNAYVGSVKQGETVTANLIQSGAAKFIFDANGTHDATKGNAGIAFSGLPGTLSTELKAALSGMTLSVTFNGTYTVANAATSGTAKPVTVVTSSLASNNTTGNITLDVTTLKAGSLPTDNVRDIGTVVAKTFSAISITNPPAATILTDVTYATPKAIPSTNGGGNPYYQPTDQTVLDAKSISLKGLSVFVDFDQNDETYIIGDALNPLPSNVELVVVNGTGAATISDNNLVFSLPGTVTIKVKYTGTTPDTVSASGITFTMNPLELDYSVVVSGSKDYDGGTTTSDAGLTTTITPDWSGAGATAPTGETNNVYVVTDQDKITFVDKNNGANKGITVGDGAIIQNTVRGDKDFLTKGDETASSTATINKLAITLEITDINAAKYAGNAYATPIKGNETGEGIEAYASIIGAGEHLTKAASGADSGATSEYAGTMITGEVIWVKFMVDYQKPIVNEDKTAAPVLLKNYNGASYFEVDTTKGDISNYTVTVVNAMTGKDNVPTEADPLIMETNVAMREIGTISKHNTGGGNTGGGTTTKTFEVTYDSGDLGTLNDTKKSILKEKVTEGESPAEIPTVQVKDEDSYVFLHWSTEKPTEEKPIPEAIDVKNTTIGEATTFYAVYAAVGQHKHYIKGMTNGTFAPAADISRAEVATIIARAIYEGEFDEENGAYWGDTDIRYSDVSGHWSEKAIAFVTVKGVFNGYDTGDFKPNQSITRQEFALVIARLDGVLDMGSDDLLEKFSDYDTTGEWAVDGLYTAVLKGWINGYTDETVRPLANIRRDEAVKVFNAYLNRGTNEPGVEGIDYKVWPDVNEDHWAYYEVAEASNDHTYYYFNGVSPAEKWLAASYEDYSN